MVDQPQPPKHPPSNPVPPVSASKKQGAQILIYAVIVFFVVAGLMMIPSVRQAIFGGGDGDAPDVAAIALPGKPLIEKPRSALPMGAYTQYFGERKSFAIEENNTKRFQYYYLVQPQKPVAGEKYPLVVFLHDEKGLADGAVQLMSLRSKLPPFYLLVPQAPDKKTWAVPDRYTGQEFGKTKLAAQWTSKKFPEARQTLQDVLILVSRLLPEMQIDDARVYAMGCGEGGIGAYGAIAKYSEFFAGALVASGIWSFGDAPKMAHTPLVIFHGTKDKVTDVIAAQGMAQVVKQLGGSVFFSELPDMARNCADPRLYSAAAVSWLFGQRKTSAAVQQAPPEDGLQPAGYMGEMAPPSPAPVAPATKP